MEKLGELNDKEIFYVKIVNGNFDIELPKEYWIAVPIGDEKNLELYSSLAEKCITDDVLLNVCCLGKECQFIHDIFDEVFVAKQIKHDFNNTSWMYSKNYTLMTTWHTNEFGEGFWYSIYSADVYDLPHNNVICFDFTEKGVKNFLLKLIDEIKSDPDEIIEDEEKYKQPEYDN